MSQETLFDVVFQGKLAAGFDRETAMANFARVFKLSTDKAAILFDGQRRTIKKNLTREKATIFRQRLKELGVRVALVKVDKETEAGSRFTLSPPGVVLSPEVYRPPVHIDTSNLSVSEITGPLVEKTDIPAPEFAIDELMVEAEYDALENPPATPEPAVDISALSVDEPGVVIVEARPQPEPEFDLGDLSLDEVGAVIVTPEPTPEPDIPTDHLSLED